MDLEESDGEDDAFFRRSVTLSPRKDPLSGCDEQTTKFLERRPSPISQGCVNPPCGHEACACVLMSV